MKEKTKKIVGILGGGAGGVASALELAKQGFIVYLFEKNKDILLGSSNATPGRAGHGFHYIHPKTGILYFGSVLEILQEFPGCLLGAGKCEEHYLHHGIYLIMKQEKDLSEQNQKFKSLFSSEEILKTYEELRKHYQKKILENPNNKLFGEPEQFFRIRNKEEFSDIVDIDKVEVIVDTREELLNWPEIRKRLCNKINIHPNISVHTSKNVQSVSYNSEGGFNLNTNQGSFTVDYVINSTWENIEKIDHTMQFRSLPPDYRTLRLKGIVKVILPESLKEKSSMFFCMGPHCMFSNMGDGTAMVTYSPITNINSTTDLELTPEMRGYLNGEATSEQKMTFAQKILEGVSLYIPGMKDAIITDVNFGIIKTLGDVDVFDPESKFHRRDYLGVEEQQLGWISNSCMKLFYFKKNSQLTAAILKEHDLYTDNIKKIIYDLSNKFKLSKDIRRSIEIYLQRNFIFDTVKQEQLHKENLEAEPEENEMKKNVELLVRQKILLMEAIRKKTREKQEIQKTRQGEQKQNLDGSAYFFYKICERLPKICYKNKVPLLGVVLISSLFVVKFSQQDSSIGQYFGIFKHNGKTYDFQKNGLQSKLTL